MSAGRALGREGGGMRVILALGNFWCAAARCMLLACMLFLLLLVL